MNAATRRARMKRPKPIEVIEDEEEGNSTGKLLYIVIYVAYNVYLFSYFVQQNTMMN